MRRTISRSLVKAFILSLTLVTSLSARAADLPLAAGSPLAGFNFDDRPLLLPVQRNFQMAMLTAGSELGRSCGRMEAYGWKMNQAEQQRVNQIFNNTVDRLRGLGYSIEAEAPASVSKDITMFTADRADRHFLFMWSAGELGLVMTLCESGSPAPLRTADKSWSSQNAAPQDVVQSHLEAMKPSEMPLRSAANFTPVGDWVGDYICAQGYTGATLHINSLNKENFEGTFHFYPTAKNPSAASGRYAVTGQYDRASQRILINPGKWITHPKNYYSTVMVGGFDPAHGTFSAYFQGINGCTSFEARYQAHTSNDSVFSKATAVKKKKHKKKAVHKARHTTVAAKPAATITVPSTVPETVVPTTAPIPQTTVPPTPAVPPTAAPAKPVVPPTPAPSAPVIQPDTGLTVPPATAPSTVPAPVAPAAPAH